MDKTQINNLKKILLEELKDKKEGLESKSDLEITELSNYDNHPADNATDITTKLVENALDDYKEEGIDKIKAALQAIEEGTYGTCKVCQTSIPYERLEAVPTTLTCKEHSQEQVDLTTRPVEEEVMNELSFKSLKTIDFEDGYGEFPSSDSPQDVPEEVIHQNIQERNIQDQL